MDALLLDVAIVFGTVRLDKALAALRKHLPELVRWFTIQHESRISLVHAAFGGVGYCETGLLQGDPLMSMLVRAIPLLDPMKRIQALLRANDAQENPRARAFAGDVFGARVDSFTASARHVTVKLEASINKAAATGWRMPVTARAIPITL